MNTNTGKSMVRRMVDVAKQGHARRLALKPKMERLLAIMNQPDSDSTDTTPQHSGTDNATEQHAQRDT